MSVKDKNRFSNLLRHLMTVTKIKNYTLAKQVQYDESYISKWISGSLLPVEKNSEKIMRDISRCEVQNWQVKEEFLKWTDNTNNAGRAWLRTPDKEESNYAMCISNDAKIENAEEKPYQNCFVFRPVKQVAGVRPAIHLNIKDIDTVVYVNNKWFNEDWMKALFLGVCVVGVVGIGIVTFAVIAKARKKA